MMAAGSFDGVSLLVKRGHQVVFQSDKSGLRPLFEAAEGGLLEESDVSDKVVGLASARVLVLCRAKKVYANVASLPAVTLLLEAKIPLHAGLVVQSILNQEKTGVCPMESKAEKMGNIEFYAEMRKIFGC